MIRRWTILRMMIRSAQSLRKSDILCLSNGFISCLEMTLRWSHDALHRLSIWQRFSWSWSKSTWTERIVSTTTSASSLSHTHTQGHRGRPERGKVFMTAAEIRGKNQWTSKCQGVRCRASEKCKVAECTATQLLMVTSGQISASFCSAVLQLQKPSATLSKVWPCAFSNMNYCSYR